MHSDKQSADPELRFTEGFFFNIISMQLIYLVDYQIPSSKIEVADTEVNTPDTCICYNVLKSLCELQIYVVEYSSHQLSKPLTPHGI